MEKLIINAAITGIVPTQAENPNLPITPDEIVADVRRCRDSGASIVHIHARNEHGLPSSEKNIYYEIMTRIREECPDILITGSTSGRVASEFSQRAAALSPGPGC